MNHLLHLFVELWIYRYKGGCAISVQHYLRMAPFHSSYMEKWHKKLHISELKMISVQNFEDNTTVLCTFCWTWCFSVDTRNGGHFVHFVQNGHHFFIKFLRQGGNLFQDNLIIFFINIINITEKNGYGGLYQWPYLL